MNHQAATNQLPIVSETDVLIIGDSAPGVECALAAKQAGLSVTLVAGVSYLGGDICADYRFWLGEKETPTTDLSRELFADASKAPTPMHVKLTLEQALVKADVPFLLNAHPAGVLTDEAGAIRGVVVGSRAGRQAFAARLVIDATPRAQVSVQSGYDAALSGTGETLVEHVTFGNWVDEDKPERVETVENLPAFEGTLKRYVNKIKTINYRLETRRHSLKVDLGDGGFDARLRAAAEVVDRCWAKGEYLFQERLRVIEDAKAVSAVDVTFDQILLGPGILRLGQSKLFSDALNVALNGIVDSMAIGSAVGACAAKNLLDKIDVGTLTVTCHGAKKIARGTVRSLDDSLRPGGKVENKLAYNASTVPILGTYDVVVVGGGTGGAPAAIGGARAGAKTLVIESTSGLGGVGTMGQIASYYYGNRVGFTTEIDAGVALMDPAEKDLGQAKWSVSAKKSWYHRECHQSEVRMAFGSVCVGTWVDEGRVRGVLMAGPEGYGLIEAGCVVDSTGCADVPAAAGAETVAIGAEHVAVQGTGLAGLDPNRSYHNTDHNFSDDTDVKDATAFFVSSKVKFKDHFDMGQLVDSRERRQIVGDLTLTAVDFLYERRFPDTVCVSSSNFDSHGFTTHPVFTVKPPGKNRLWVDVPFRALLPRDLDGVLVTGLGVSAHRDALPVIRMQPDVQNQGYAAGRAAAMSAQKGCAVRDIDLAELQTHLIKIGNLPDRVLTDVDNFPVADDVMLKAVKEDWDDAVGLALIFSDPERSKPLLIAELKSRTDDAARLRFAQILAMLNDPAGLEVLAQAVANADWDDGWNYKGMGQFGMSLSTVDSLIIALGTVGDEHSWNPILDKLKSLPEEPAFSHCRALAMACERLFTRHPDDRVAAQLSKILLRPKISGHHHLNQAQVQAALTKNPVENKVRNISLRELVLARSVLRCGDHERIGREIMEKYTSDLRGHFARHARAVLEEDNAFVSIAAKERLMLV